MKQKGIAIQSLKNVLDKITFIDGIAWDDFSQTKIEKTIKKGDIIWREGQICKHLIFLKNGLIRSYYLNNSREVTLNFYEDGNLFYDDYSFISQKPSKNTFQALTDSALILIPRDHLLAMYDKHKCFEKIGRISVENAHIEMIEKRERLIQNSAEKNYKHLLSTQPHLIQTLPQKLIASYLNISTEHLSRIRGNVKI